jgi:hypothetical protein
MTTVIPKGPQISRLALVTIRADLVAEALLAPDPKPERKMNDAPGRRFASRNQRSSQDYAGKW